MSEAEVKKSGFVWRPRYIVYAILLVVSIFLAIWAYHEPAYLAELRETRTVTEGTEDAVAYVESALEAIQNNDRKKISSMILVQDSTEIQRITASLWTEPAFAPAKVTKCTTLVHCHRPDNISVFVYSENRKKEYQFALQRIGDKFMIRSISAMMKME